MTDSFSNTCKLQKELLPEKTCPEGDLGAGSRETKGCMWYINSEQDYFCFWRWSQRRSDANGTMSITPNKEIPKLLNLPVTKAPQLLQEALENFTKLEEFTEIKDYLKTSK